MALLEIVSLDNLGGERFVRVLRKLPVVSEQYIYLQRWHQGFKSEGANNQL